MQRFIPVGFLSLCITLCFIFISHDCQEPSAGLFVLLLDREVPLIPCHQSELPSGTEVLEITPSGASAWVQTVRIRTRQKDGTTKDYFKKV